MWISIASTPNYHQPSFPRDLYLPLDVVNEEEAMPAQLWNEFFGFKITIKQESNLSHKPNKNTS